MSLRDQDQDRQQKAETETETKTLKIGLETFITGLYILASLTLGYQLC